jgi:hypothetical protein
MRPEGIGHLSDVNICQFLELHLRVLKSSNSCGDVANL